MTRCDDCDEPITPDFDRSSYIVDPWGNRTGERLCDNCQEKRWYRWQERLMEDGSDPMTDREKQDLRDAGRGHLV